MRLDSVSLYRSGTLSGYMTRLLNNYKEVKHEFNNH